MEFLKFDIFEFVLLQTLIDNVVLFIVLFCLLR